MRLLAFLLMLTLTGTASALTRTEANVRAYSVYVEFMDGGHCTATKIGKRTLLIAAHCVTEEPGAVIVDGTPVNVTKIHLDGGDQARIEVRAEFKRYAVMGDLPKQGDTVFMFGNPGMLRGILRRGYVSGEGGGLIVTDINIGKGDSGSAVFNERGQVVGIVSGYYVHDAFVIAGIQPVIRVQSP